MGSRASARTIWNCQRTRTGPWQQKRLVTAATPATPNTLLASVNAMLQGRTPTEAQVQSALASCLQIEPPPPKSKTSPTSHMLGLDTRVSAADIASRIITHPSNPLSTESLEILLQVSKKLNNPSLVIQGLRQFQQQDAKRSVPKKLADESLNLALEHRDLRQCLEVIKFTTGSASYQRARLGKGASTLALGFCGMMLTLKTLSLGAFYIASEYGIESTPQGTSMAVTIGMAAYLLAVGWYGTFYLLNVHRGAVGWTVGIGFTERWKKEDERLSYQRVLEQLGESPVLRRNLRSSGMELAGLLDEGDVL